MTPKRATQIMYLLNVRLEDDTPDIMKTAPIFMEAFTARLQANGITLNELSSSGLLLNASNSQPLAPDDISKAGGAIAIDLNGIKYLVKKLTPKERRDVGKGLGLE